MGKVIAIQQPEHIPWLGFFDKMLKCDEYVYLDNVQFKKRYYENRNQILTPQGPAWITVPVISKGKYTQNINEVEIDNSQEWERKYLETIRRNYAKTPYFTQIFPDLVESVQSNNKSLLVDLNLALINQIRKFLGIQTNHIFASKIFASEIRGSDLILAICINRGANKYISGPDGRNYLNLVDFEKAGIEVVYHDFVHPEYAQHYSSQFYSHMSIIDYLFNKGDKPWQ